MPVSNPKNSLRTPPGPARSKACDPTAAPHRRHLSECWNCRWLPRHLRSLHRRRRGTGFASDCVSTCDSIRYHIWRLCPFGISRAKVHSLLVPEKNMLLQQAQWSRRTQSIRPDFIASHHDPGVLSDRSVASGERGALFRMHWSSEKSARPCCGSKRTNIEMVSHGISSAALESPLIYRRKQEDENRCQGLSCRVREKGQALQVADDC
jgi:hypothetical protein